MDEQQKWFLENDPAPDKDTVNIVKMTTKEFKYYINLLDKVAVGFERIEINSVLKEVLLRVKCYQTAMHAREKSLQKEVNGSNKLYWCLILRNYGFPRLWQWPPWSVSSHQHRGRPCHQETDYDSLKAWMIRVFYQ